MLVESFPVGPLKCNCSIIACPDTREAAVIDPGGDAQVIVEALERHGLKCKYLLHTHAHFDHVLGARAVKEATGADICLHEGDRWLYDNLAKQGSLFGFQTTDPLPVDRYLCDEELVEIGTLKTRVIHTPGHTPGSLCFWLPEKESVLFAGDTLFRRSIGRTDLWGGSFEQIIDSIAERLFKLDDSTLVIPGHGTETTIWEEKRENPFF
ncbi:MAG TPA: MBL fold metallo-hydrolase [Candidatus Obscuribacterales bacterium]